MAEYIEREAVRAMIKHRLGTLDLFESRFNADLDALPAADVVEVVRCEDCVYGTLCENMAGADYVDCSLDDQSTRLPHDFCSYGDRRDDDGET